MTAETPRTLNKRDEILLKFMAMTIEKINTCYANTHAIQTLLIEKGILSANEIIQRSKDSKALPERRIGRKVLSEIMEDAFVDRLSQMIQIPE